MGESIREYCTRVECTDLLAQWHRSKNGSLTPDGVSCGSHRKIWWQCERGHEWQSPPYSRVGSSNGCPYCAGKKLSPEQSLQALYPEIAEQWHPVKNGRMRPDQVFPGSKRLVWWQCRRGHEWQSRITSRTDGAGCPVCANRVVLPGVNDLGTVAPDLAVQWHPDKNGDLLASQVSAGSTRKVWWRCTLGHEWQAAVYSRMAGRGCPVCTGRITVPGENDLESHSPELARQWNRERNGGLKPDQVSIYSNKRVWWRCKRGHEWQTPVSARTRGKSGCPYCGHRKLLTGFNDLKTLEPLVAAQWHPERNGSLDPTMVMPGSTKRVWWRCIDGHEWTAVIYSRTGSQKCGCPVCAGKTARRA